VATHPRIAFSVAKTLSGLPVPRQSFPEAATQTFKNGAPVVLTAGYLQECPANPPLIVGVASRDGQNGATAGAKKQTVYLAHPDVVFRGNLDNGGTEDSGVGAATDLGKMYGITKHATNGKWYVDKNKAAAATRRVVIWQLWDAPITGTTGSAVAPAWTDTIPQVLFQFDPQFFQGNRTS
jgi:hypothetical protein